VQKQWMTEPLPPPPTGANAFEVYDAHEVCAGCPGFCCRRFYLTFTDEDAKLDILRCDDELATLLAKRRRTAKDRARIGALRRIRYDSVFSLRNFKRLRHLDGFLMYAYTCKALDPKLGRCRAYAERSYICRKFICQSYLDTGKKPRNGTDETHGRVRWGKNVLRRRKAAKTKKEKKQ
jgi:Fe-S-cluster containining protein